MKNLDYIDFEIEGQEISIEFNQPHWSDNDDNFSDCLEGKIVRYKNDLID